MERTPSVFSPPTPPSPGDRKREKTVPLYDSTPEKDTQETSISMECDETMPSMVKRLPQKLVAWFRNRDVNSGLSLVRCTQSPLRPEVHDQGLRNRKQKTHSVFGAEPESPCEYFPMQIHSKRYPYAVDARLIIRTRPVTARRIDAELSRLLGMGSSAAEGESRPKTPAPRFDRGDDDLSKHKVLVLDTKVGGYSPPDPSLPTPSSKTTNVMVNPYADPKVLRDFKAPRRTRTFDFDLTTEEAPQKMEEDPPSPYDAWSRAKSLRVSCDGPAQQAMLAEVERDRLSKPARLSVVDWLGRVESSLQTIAQEPTNMKLMHDRVAILADQEKLTDAMRSFGIDRPTHVCDSEEAIDEDYKPYNMKKRMPHLLEQTTGKAIHECLKAQRALFEFQQARARFQDGMMSVDAFVTSMDKALESVGGGAVASGMLAAMFPQSNKHQDVETRADKLAHLLQMNANGKAMTMGMAVRDAPVIVSRGVCMELTQFWAVEKDAKLYEYYSKDYVTLKQRYLQRCAEMQAVQIRLIEQGLEKLFKGNPPTSQEMAAMNKEIANCPQQSPSPPLPISPSAAVPSQPSGSQGKADAPSGAAVEQAIVEDMTSGAPRREKPSYIVQQLDDMKTVYEFIAEDQELGELKEAMLEVMKELAEMEAAFKANGMSTLELSLLGRVAVSLDEEYCPSDLVKCDYATLGANTLEALARARDANVLCTAYTDKLAKFVSRELNGEEFTAVIEETLEAMGKERDLYARGTPVPDRADILKGLVYKHKLDKEGAFARQVKLQPTLSFRGYTMTWATFNNVKPGMYAVVHNNFIAYTFQDLKIEFLKKCAELQAIQIRIVKLTTWEKEDEEEDA